MPTILQMEAVECGAASLAMVLAHYGKWIPLERLRQECAVTRDGSNANNIIKAARNLGCDAKGFAGIPAGILKKEFPLILFWEFSHFVVMEGYDGDNILLNDPAMGRRSVPWNDFIGSYTGVHISVRPGPNFKKEGGPYNIFKTLGQKLWEDKWAVLFVLILGLCMLLPGLAVPVMNQIFLDDILSMKRPDLIDKLLLGMGGAMLFMGILTAMRAAVLTAWQKKLTLADSSSFFWHVIRLPLPFFQQRYAADIASRIAYNEQNAQIISDQAATVVLDFLIALFYLGLLMQYSVTLTIIGVSISFINLFIVVFMRQKLTDLTLSIQKDGAKTYGVIMAGISIIESIKGNGSEGDLFAKWAGYKARLQRSTQDMMLWSMKIKLIPTLLIGINSALIMTIGGFSIMEGIMTAGSYMAFQNLLSRFQEPFGKLLSLGSILQNVESQMQRLDDVRKNKIDELNFPSAQAPEENPAKDEKLTGELELKNVCFGYSPLDPPLIQDFNLHLLPGRWAAIVGASGSGKSTLGKIICGLYEEWSGDILFDGKKRKDIPRAVMVNSVSAVDQDVFQLSGTVRENIAMFDKSISKNDIIRAAKDACIHDDILKLNSSYDAKVSEGGSNFSGGQRQRLEIAKALALNPSLIILDEATSALDAITEQQVLENIRRRGVSAVLVAHRLSTIRDADEIIVLDHGKTVERGRHNDLMKSGGAYSRLIKEQTAEEEQTVSDKIV